MKKIFNPILIFGVALSLLVTSCKSPVTVIDKLENLGIDKYFDIQHQGVEQNRLLPDWETYYFDTNDCRCVFGTDYFVFVKDNVGKNNNLLFALQGGGACWPGMEEMCKTEVTEEDVYNAEYHYHNDNSPVKGWNTVFVPYCDGSVHGGDNAADYDRDGEIDYWHWGLHSTSAAVVLAKKLYPDPEKIYITGCSAGGYGTFTAVLIIRLQYPDTKIYVMNESGPGLNNPEDRETWETIKKTWIIHHIIPEDCEQCDGQQIFLYEWMLKHDPNLKIGLYSSNRDEVIGVEFLKMEKEVFMDHLLSTSGHIHDAFPDRFKRFIIDTNTHCVQDYEYEINGTSLTEWIEQLVTDDPGWEDLLE